MQDFIKINNEDNVAVALRDLSKEEKLFVAGDEVKLTCDIPRGHKFALKNFSENENVIKYGFPIGHTISKVEKGEHIHVHNLKTNLGDNLTYTYNPVDAFPEITEELPKTFMGYVRSNGKVGVRNEIWIVPTVGCVNSVAKAIEGACQDLVGEGLEGVVAFNHPYGCSQMGDDQENTREALAGLINHPNAGGVLVLGLGCENSNIEVLKPYLGNYDEDRIKFLVSQEVEDEIETACEIIKDLAKKVRGDKRSEVSASKLVIGMKCGGSDGLSGITANPIVGRFSDLLTSKEGTTILTEVPEMFGAETILMDRALDTEVFDKTVDLIQDFKDYFRKNNQTIYENPSPGNKAGGISTLEDKALGCTQKSGFSVVKDVLKYAQPVSKTGLNLLSAPGNDLVASTALAISGAQIVLFTTGRGTPFAAAVPTVKISTNTPLATKKNGWIDFDCGVLLEDGETIENMGKELYNYVLKVANGEKVKSEVLGFRDLAIFKQGVTL